MLVLTRINLSSKSKNERDYAKRLKERMDSYEFILLEGILRAIGTASHELPSPQLYLTVASRLLCCSNSELRVLRGYWNSIKQTASALASAWRRVVDFKPKTRRSINGALDDNIINTLEQAF